MSTEHVNCSKCGSTLSIRCIKLRVRDKDELYCPVCGDQLRSWNEAKMWIAEVIERAENHLQKQSSDTPNH